MNKLAWNGRTGIGRFDRSLILYTAGRLSAVASRPVLLFVTVNWLPAAAGGLATALLASSLAMGAAAAEPHRRFYRRYFRPGRANGVAFFLYLASLGVMAALGSAFVFTLARLFAGSFVLAMASCVYFLSEKLVDEVLRFRLFEPRLDLWGGAALWRAVLQLAGVAILLRLAGRDTPAWAEVSVLAAGNLAAFLPQLPGKLWRNVRFRHGRAALWLVRRAVRWLSGNLELWILALLTGAGTYLDRLIGMLVDRAMFPIFLEVSMCMSVVQLLPSFYYFSRNRRAFLEGRVRPPDVLLGRGFWRSVASGLLFGGSATALALMFSAGGRSFPLPFVFLIATFQILLALVVVLREIPYWTGSIARMIRVEVVFFAMAGAAVVASQLLGLSASGLLALIIVCVACRVAMYAGLAPKAATDAPAPAQEVLDVETT